VSLDKELKLQERARALNRKLTACRSVKRVLNQKGWRTILQPLLDAMITDVLGGKRGNMYTSGAVSKPDDKSIEYYIGYKQALIDFNNRVWNYVESMQILSDQIKKLEEQAGEPEKYINPMMEGPYAGAGDGF
jgi:hypothetical protein